MPAIAVLMGLGTGVGVMFPPGHHFRPQAMSRPIRKPTAARLLSVVALSATLVKLAGSGLLPARWAPTLAALVVVLVVGVATGGTIYRLPVMATGVLVPLWLLRTAATLAVGVIAMLLTWLYGLAGMWR